ncbi:MAG TPA: hypothetical protein VFY16_07190, partial [Gemmatimonadaceae bacterium]|nr:hypothetical protein [Gemmatimonadaceae bacterium]
MPAEPGVSRHLVARAPTRIDFGGGWTDVPPYDVEQGGFVCNVAIARYATATLVDGGPDAATGEGSDLARAALRRLGPAGARLTLAADFPTGAGLGGSSAAGVAALGACLAWRAERLEPAALAETSRLLEVEDLAVAGGRQDHYAAAYGGALALHFTDRVTPNPIPLAADVVAALERRCVVVYTGASRISGAT